MEKFSLVVRKKVLLSKIITAALAFQSMLNSKNMKSFLYTLFLILSVYIFTGSSYQEPASGSREGKPNIILIMADDLGQEALACYGAAEYKTPVLDSLAASGLRFTQCHAQPICTPTRVQIMTGLYNNRNYQGFEYLDPGQVTFAQLLKKGRICYLYRRQMAAEWMASEKTRMG